MKYLLSLACLFFLNFSFRAQCHSLDERRHRLENDLSVIKENAYRPRYMGAGIRFGMSLLFGAAAMAVERSQPEGNRPTVIGLGGAAAATALAGTLVLALPNPSATAVDQLKQNSNASLEAKVAYGEELLNHVAETRKKGRFIGGAMLTLIGFGFATWAVTGSSQTHASRLALGTAGLLMAGVGTATSLLSPSFEEQKLDAYLLWRDAPQTATRLRGIGLSFTQSL